MEISLVNSPAAMLDDAGCETQNAAAKNNSLPADSDEPLVIPAYDQQRQYCRFCDDGGDKSSIAPSSAGFNSIATVASVDGTAAPTVHGSNPLTSRSANTTCPLAVMAPGSSTDSVRSSIVRPHGSHVGSNDSHSCGDRVGFDGSHGGSDGSCDCWGDHGGSDASRAGSDDSSDRSDDSRDGCRSRAGCDDLCGSVSLQLFVKTLNGKTITVNTSASALVHDVKLCVQAKTGIPPYEQRLIFRGKQLEDARSVMASGVGAWSTLHLNLRLCGGAITFEALKVARKDPFCADWDAADSQALVSHFLNLHGFDSNLTAVDAGEIMGETSDRDMRKLSVFKRFLQRRNAEDCADSIFQGKHIVLKLKFLDILVSHSWCLFWQPCGPCTSRPSLA